MIPARTALLFLLCLPGAGLAEGAEEDWNATFQATYVWQKKPACSAAYSGPRSLSTESEISYTATATAYLGIRPWAGGELFFNPEVTQGVPFSDLTGLGGFTNGEVTRAAGTNPKIYRQRLFLRQTWNLGGEREAVESGMNQLAGEVTRDRFVLTVGNFSTLDVFDTNAFAHDPRTQFMNWSAMTYAAYDYAADSRGFGWGFAGEWYKGDWVLRFGRMTPPREPNMTPVDPAFFRHYGDQVEVEHAHSLGGQPGNLRVLAWRNRAVLARYQDALDDAVARGATPDIFRVRSREQIKYGVGLNLEQAVNDRLGTFLRLMWADGGTETLAFTEVDRSVAAGAVLKGTAWGRPQDTVGLALMGNMLSRERRDYLKAGGISFFIGDGALSYRPETILEGYYNWNVTDKVWVTVDYQRIHNPAYNADRGPVNVGSIRLHTEF